MIRAIFFDLDGTLYDRDALVRALVAEQPASFANDLQGVAPDRFVADVLEMDDHGFGDKREGYRRLVAEWQLAPALADRLCEDFWLRYHRHCVLPPDTAQTLQSLRAHGKLLGVITNGQTERQRATLVALGLDATFDIVLISEAEGVRKPGSEIFERALRLCGVEANEAVFVGDHPETDIEGARNAGLLPLWKQVPYWSLRTTNIPLIHRLSDILPVCLTQ